MFVDGIVIDTKRNMRRSHTSGLLRVNDLRGYANFPDLLPHGVNLVVLVPVLVFVVSVLKAAAVEAFEFKLVLVQLKLGFQPGLAEGNGHGAVGFLADAVSAGHDGAEIVFHWVALLFMSVCLLVCLWL